jgi:hypothetical protein
MDENYIAHEKKSVQQRVQSGKSTTSVLSSLSRLLDRFSLRKPAKNNPPLVITALGRVVPSFQNTNFASISTTPY